MMVKGNKQRKTEENFVEITTIAGHKILVDTSREICEKYGGEGIVAGSRIVDPVGYHGVMVGVCKKPLSGKTNFWYLRDKEAESGRHVFWLINLFNETLRDEGFLLESEWEAKQKAQEKS